MTPQHLTKGIYYVDILMTGGTKNQKYKDVWQGVTFNPGIDQQNFEQQLQILGNYYTNFPTETNEYAVSLYGLSNNEILKKGELIRIYADTRVAYSTKAPTEYYGLEYRLIQNEVTEIVPWTAFNTIVLNNCNKEYIDLDTSWLLDNQNYKIELRINELGTKKIIDELIYFRVES